MQCATQAIMREWSEKEKRRKRDCADYIAAMEPCAVCGRKIGYDTDPERFIVCRHVRDELRKLSPSPAGMGITVSPTLSGIPVEVVP